MGKVSQVLVINHARSHVMQLHLTCVTSNLYAVAFYQKYGFKIHGIEPCVLKIEDAFFDEYLMILSLAGSAPKQFTT